jgi:hypothetical protein
MADIGFDFAWQGYGSSCCDDGVGRPDCVCPRCGYGFHSNYGYEFSALCPCCVADAKCVTAGIEFAGEDEEEVLINAAIAKALSPEKINEILTEWCKAHDSECEKGIIKYIDENIGDFAAWAEENC